MKRIGPLFILLAGSLWGLLGAFVRVIGSYGYTSMQIVCSRSLLTVVFLFIFLFIYDRKLLHAHWNDLWMFFGTGVCSIVFFSFCYFRAISLTSLSTAIILLYTSPIFVTLLSALLFHERITLRKMIALLLAFSGCLLITGIAQDQMNLTLTALFYGIGAGFGYALYSIFGHFAVKKYHAFTITFYTFLFASIASMLFCQPSALFHLMSEKPSSLIPIILASILCSAVPYILYTLGLAHTEAGQAAIFACVEPVVGTLVSVVYLQERLTPWNVAGILLVLVSLVILNLPQKNS